MHKNGPYFVNNGSICSMYNNGFMVDEDTTILVDLAVGTLLRVGKKEIVTNYYNVIVEKYTKLDCLELLEEMKLITFNICYPNLEYKPDNYNFTIDEVCTIINWFSNSIGAEKMKWFLSLNLNDAKQHIECLQGIGF